MNVVDPEQPGNDMTETDNTQTEGDSGAQDAPQTTPGEEPVCEQAASMDDTSAGEPQPAGSDTAPEEQDAQPAAGAGEPAGPCETAEMPAAPARPDFGDEAEARVVEPAPAGTPAADTDAGAEQDSEVKDLEALDAEGRQEGFFELIQQLEYVPPAKTGKGRKQQPQDGETKLEIGGVAEARQILEGFLFATNEPLSVARLAKLMNNMHPRTVRGLLLELQMEYDNRGSGIQILEVAGGFQMATRPHLADWIFRMHRHRKRNPLTSATLETLAIIAYRQPITRAEIETVRGVESSATVRTLLEFNLIEVAGKREVPGRPQLYATTEQFLKTFGLKSLSELPSIQELKQLFASGTKEKRAKEGDEPTGEQARPSEPSAEAQAPEPAEEQKPTDTAEPTEAADQPAEEQPEELAADSAEEEATAEEATAGEAGPEEPDEATEGASGPAPTDEPPSEEELLAEDEPQTDVEPLHDTETHALSEEDICPPNAEHHAEIEDAAIGEEDIAPPPQDEPRE